MFTMCEVLVVELSLFAVSLFILVVGFSTLDVRWVWDVCLFCLVSFVLLSITLKNIIFIEVSHVVNLSCVFVAFLCFVLTIVFSQRTSIERDLFFWMLFMFFGLYLGYFACVDYISCNVNTVPTYWISFNGDGSIYNDIRCATLLIGAATVVAILQRGCSFYEHDYAVLMVIALLSGLLLISSNHLMIVYLNFELQALALYCITSYYRFEESATEAGLKYVLIGSLISGFFLLGSLVVYFENGSLIVSELSGYSSWVVSNLIFKVGLAPFYFWTPAVYQSMDYATLLFVGSLPKLGAWYLIFNNLYPFVNDIDVYLIALASIVIGAFGGLFQRTIPSLIAYSSILNGGYLLLFTGYAPFTVGLYLIGYYMVVSLLLISFTYNGFSYFIYYILLNLGGLPVLPGFSYKIYLLLEIVHNNLFNAIIVVSASLFAVYYYIRLAGRYLFTGQHLNQLHFVYEMLLVVCAVSVVESLLVVVGGG